MNQHDASLRLPLRTLYQSICHDAAVGGAGDDMKLDPHFGAATGKELMFELRLSVIKAETEAIARSADFLWFKTSPSTQLARFDMEKSIQALRDAADRLEQVRGKQPVAEAAE